MTGFVHLHVHSDFSLQDAAVSVMHLADRAEALGMKHLALTDHGNMFGAMELLAACEETIKTIGGKEEHVKRKNPIQPIIGCEAYVSPGSRFEKRGTENENKYYHLVLLAKNRQGYLNLVKLCSFAYTEGFYYRPRIDGELLARYHEGLICLSACVSGEIPKLIQAGKNAEAEAKAVEYRDLFGRDETGEPNFYLEIQDHGIPAEVLRNTNLSQVQINEALVEIARKTGIPLVATNDVHYLAREDAVAHDALLCIGTGKLRTEEKRKKYYGDQFYFKTGDEMAALFPKYPEAIANTVRIAERCKTDVPKVKTKDLCQLLPEFEIPLGFATADDYLRHLAVEGLAKRYHKEKAASSAGDNAWEEIQKRMEYELDVIIQMGFTGYFLIVADFINWAKERDISVGPGRGSGAGSIVAYALRITNMDPLKYNLLFERFLNPERISMPDFDVDFANEGRKDVIEYVTEKYGRENVGQIITFGTLGAKQVIRDVARTLGISIPESEMISKLIPGGPGVSLGSAFKAEPRLGEFEADPRYTELFSLARKLEGLNRHASLHAAGVVIGKSALDNFVPLYRDPKTGGIATQYTMGHLEECGLVKMDFLGIKTLDVIKHTEELIRRRGSEYAQFNIEHVSEHDEATFKMLGEGKSFEIFQFESEGMQNILKQAKPGKIEDLIALNALYRPGPMANIPQFIESKNGRQRIEYPDPSLEEILKETYGVIIYQEQVMQVTRVIAGFTLGHADELRRAMGKKNMEKMVKEKERFLAGAVERGYQKADADRIFELLIPFAGYGFNKSHAAAYAVVAYQTAYLKAHFPAEFMAANLSNEIHSTDKDKLSACIDESRKMGIPIDPPDVNRSDKLFTVVEGRIVYGFLGIKGLGDGPIEGVLACRQEEGVFTGFMDFLERANMKPSGLAENPLDKQIVSKKAIELLIKAGAFDCFDMSRTLMFANVERAVEYVKKTKEDKQFGQSSLFENTGEQELAPFVFEKADEWEPTERLNYEKELLGFYFSGHPMDEYKELWERAVKANLGRPETLSPGSCILVGIVKGIKTIVNSKGNKMAFASLEDYRGSIELTFFDSAWRNAEGQIEADKVAILKGKIEYQKYKDQYSFVADGVLSPQEADAALAGEETRSRKWDKYRNIWKYPDITDPPILALDDPDGTKPGNYTLAGLIKTLRTHQDKKGNEMAFGTLQDERGEIDLVFFAKDWKNCKDLAAVDEMAALRGSLDAPNERNRKASFKVSSIQDINKLVRAAAKRADTTVVAGTTGAGKLVEPVAVPDDDAAAITSRARVSDSGNGLAPRSVSREVHIRLKEAAVDRDEDLYPLRDFLIDNPGPCQVFIHIPVSGRETVVRTAPRISADADQERIAALSACEMVSAVWTV
ncbi:MAG: DNA polymerase III subunit alpha [Treponema sp.]|jgi:DNA polymerase-3 subunit alpha|nr:DNA polymerase III subunit alpha [Treponema sp.]